MKKIIYGKIVIILIFALTMGLFALPQDIKGKIPVSIIQNSKVNLGLDLAGGRQLDFKVDLSRAKEQGKSELEIEEIVDGVAEVLARRIDPDGTKELNIQTADFGDEKHVLVDITADIDTQETRELLQKRIDLEFKELKAEADETDMEVLKTEADEALTVLQSAEDFRTSAEELSGASKTANYREKNVFQDQLDEDVAAAVWDQEVGTIVGPLATHTYVFANNSIEKQETFSIFLVGEKVVEEREKTEPGEDFTEITENVATGKISEFSEATQEKLLALGDGEVSEIIQEADGTYAFYRTLQLEEDETEAKVAFIASIDQVEIEAWHTRASKKTTSSEEEKLILQELFFMPVLDQWQSTGLDGQYFKKAKVDQDPRTSISIVSIQFDEEGAKLFEEITERNIGKPVAIFVGGVLISAPNVHDKISGGSAQITSGVQNFFEAKKWAIELSSNLNAGAIGAPIELDGDTKVKASLGADALEASLFASLIGLGILAVYMLFAYRLLGLIAVLALLIYSSILLFILNFTSIFVLTLAGVAGIVLSIGMAVDANILIFERMKEELRDGKNFSAALSLGFDRAWTSIRDSNISSLITCAILYIFGTSIIKGFAVMLALGILISMFTAITITKTFLSAFVGTKLSRKTKIFTKQ